MLNHYFVVLMIFNAVFWFLLFREFDSSCPVGVELETVRLSTPIMSVMAFGDWGVNGPPLRKSMNRFHEGFSGISDAVFLLGDNFYPSGISRRLGLEDPQFDLFRSLVARHTQCPYYAILGNHDTEGDVYAQVAFSDVEPRWHMPSRYYFQKFRLSEGLRVCVWFLDTEQQRNGTQLEWLDDSISRHKSSCAWLIVVGHHPVYTSGEYHRFTGMQRWLLPVLQRHKVDLYISGHEHQSQILKDEDFQTTYLIAGAIADLRHGSLQKDAKLIWGNAKKTALLSLVITKVGIFYAYHGVDNSQDDAPMYSGVITK